MLEHIIMRDSFVVSELFDTGSATTMIKKAQNESDRGNQILYFLDIEIKDKLTQVNQVRKGLEVAQEIRKIDRFASIVFVTTHSEFAPITYTYQVSALQFIAKDQPENELKSQLRSCLEYVAASGGQSVPEDVFQFETEYTSMQIPFSDVLYFETLLQPHKVAIVTSTQRIEFYSSLKKIEDSDKRFIRCHKSFVVNACNIVSINRESGILHLKNGAECYLARRKLKAVLAGQKSCTE